MEVASINPSDLKFLGPSSDVLFEPMKSAQKLGNAVYVKYDDDPVIIHGDYSEEARKLITEATMMVRFSRGFCPYKKAIGLCVERRGYAGTAIGEEALRYDPHITTFVVGKGVSAEQAADFIVGLARPPQSDKESDNRKTAGSSDDNSNDPDPSKPG